MSSMPLASAYVSVLPDRKSFDSAMTSLIADFKKDYTTLVGIAKPISLKVKFDATNTTGKSAITALRDKLKKPIVIPVRFDITTRSGVNRITALRDKVSKSITIPVKLGGLSAKGLNSLTAAFQSAGKAKDAFAANVAAKMPLIRRQLDMTAASARRLGLAMPSRVTGGGGGGGLTRRRGFMSGGGGLGLGGVGAGVGIYGIGAALKKTSDDAAIFENRMQQIKGILDETSGSTPAAIKNFNQLSYAAMRLSKESLGFGPLKVAETFQELAEKGWTLNQVISTTPRIMDLASVANMDLAKTSEIVAGTLNAYQLDVSKAGEVTDILQSSANKSSANLEYLGEALHHTSGFASLMGMNLQETVALLGGMSQSSVKASEAGYAMSTMFQRLINPTTRGTAALKEIDNIFKVTGKKRDEFFVGNTIKKGKMMDFLEVVQDFKNKVGDEHFGSTFSRIVGAKGGKLMQGFAYRDPKSGKSGIGEVVRMRKEIEGDVRGPGKKGIVEKQREIVENNFLNTTKRLVAALERMRISLGATINTELVQFVKGLTSVVDLITDLNDKYDGLIGKLAIASVAMAAFVVGATVIKYIVGSLLLLNPVITAIGFTIGALVYSWMEHKNEWMASIEEIILKYRELISVLVGAAKWTANQAGLKTFDQDYADAEYERKQQAAAAKLAWDYAKKEREERKKKYDEERSAMEKGKGTVPGGPGETHSEPWDDSSGKEGKKGSKDNLDIVGIEELHNKIQKNLFGDTKDDLLRQIRDNTKKMADKPSFGGVTGGGATSGGAGGGGVGLASSRAVDLADAARKSGMKPAGAGGVGVAPPWEKAGPERKSKLSADGVELGESSGLGMFLGPKIISSPAIRKAEQNKQLPADGGGSARPLVIPPGTASYRQRQRPELDSMLADTGGDMAFQIAAAQRNRFVGAGGEPSINAMRGRATTKGYMKSPLLGSGGLPLVGESQGMDLQQDQDRDQTRQAHRTRLQGMFKEQMHFEGEFKPTSRTTTKSNVRGKYQKQSPLELAQSLPGIFNQKSEDRFSVASEKRLGLVSRMNDARVSIASRSSLPPGIARNKMLGALGASNAKRMSVATNAEEERSKNIPSASTYGTDKIRTSPEIMKNKQSMILAKLNEKREDQKIANRLSSDPNVRAKQEAEDKRAELGQKAREAGKLYKGGGSQAAAMRGIVSGIGAEVRAGDAPVGGKYTTRTGRTRVNAGFAQATLPGGSPAGQASAIKNSVGERNTEKGLDEVATLLKEGNEKSDKLIETMSNLEMGYQ